MKVRKIREEGASRWFKVNATHSDRGFHHISLYGSPHEITLLVCQRDSLRADGTFAMKNILAHSTTPKGLRDLARAILEILGEDA